MIGGNITVELQISTATKNAIGETERKYVTACKLTGFIDLAGGQADYAYNAKIQASTHIFICDYKLLPKKAKAQNSRILDPNGSAYDVLLIDNPMELNEHYEIYLKYLGG